MARLRKFCAYRRLERPYTRISKYRKKSFIRASPHKVIVRYNMGNHNKKYDYTLNLITKKDIQIRDNALESARQSSNRVLETELGNKSYSYKIMVYPHHILRENPLAAGAGADRLSTGMKMSFGKAIGNAARIKKGQTIIQVGVNKANLDLARKAMTRARNKLPTKCMVDIIQNK